MSTVRTISDHLTLGWSDSRKHAVRQQNLYGAERRRARHATAEAETTKWYSK